MHIPNFFPMSDLHFHSTDSDGNKTNAERIEQIRRLDPKNTGIWAMTNHDRYSPGFVLPARAQGIRSVWATEISAHSQELDISLHITCYTPRLSEGVRRLTDAVLIGKNGKILQQITKLRSHGFPIDSDGFFSWMDSIGHDHANASNWHLSEYLWKKPETPLLVHDLTQGKVTTQFSFLLDCLKENGSYAHIGAVKVSPYEPELSTLVSLARTEDMLLSVAHPNFSFLKYTYQNYQAQASKEKSQAFETHIAPKLVDIGIRNFEINTMATPEWVEVVDRVTRSAWGILTYGSDSHGWEEQVKHRDSKHAFFWEKNSALTPEMVAPVEKKLLEYGE